MITEIIGNKNNSGFSDLTYSYEGVCDNNLLVSFTELLTGTYPIAMTMQEYKIVLFCANELLQNIGFYSFEKELTPDNILAGKGKFTLKSNESEIVITTDNQISEGGFEKLATRLDMYNSLNPDELKLLYKQMLKAESPDDSKGGGIGLIEIIRKAKSPILYSRRDAENKNFVNLQLKMRRIKNYE